MPRAIPRPTIPPNSAPRMRVGAVSRSRLSNATTTAANAAANAMLAIRLTGSGRSKAAAYATAATIRTRASANQAMRDPRYEPTTVAHQMRARGQRIEAGMIEGSGGRLCQQGVERFADRTHAHEFTGPALK